MFSWLNERIVMGDEASGRLPACLYLAIFEQGSIPWSPTTVMFSPSLKEKAMLEDTGTGSNPYNPRRAIGVANEFYDQWLHDHDTLVQVALDRHQKFIDLVNTDPESDGGLFVAQKEFDSAMDCLRLHRSYMYGLTTKNKG